MLVTVGVYEGMVKVTLVVTLPTSAPADVYVEQVTLHTPLVALGI